MVSNINARNATLSWSPPTHPNGVIQNYYITLVQESGTSRTIDTGDDSLSFLLDMLTPFTNYSVTLVAVNQFSGEASETRTFTTSQDSKFYSQTCVCIHLYNDPDLGGTGTKVNL